MRKKSKKANPLKGLLIFALLGILGLQGFWIAQSMLIREMQFNRLSYRTVQRISERIRAYDAREFIQNRRNLQSKIEKTKENVFRYLDTVPGERQVLRYERNNATLDSAGYTIHYSNSYSADQGAYQAPVVKDPEMEREVDNLDSLMQIWMLQEFSGSSAIEERIPLDVIDSIIQSELNHAGLNTRFEFAIYEGKELTNLHSEKFSTNHKAIQFPIIRGDFFQSPRFLMIYFPRKFNFLFWQLGGVLFLTLSLVGLIVFIFWKVWSQMKKQKRLSEIKSDFINNMTHEFKTPIATISLATSALKNEEINQYPEKIQHYTQIIKQENKRMNEQVERILKMSMMDRKEIVLEKEDMSVNHLLTNSANRVKLQIEELGGHLNLHLLSEDIDLSIDPVHFEMALVNLLDNAKKYSIEKPEVTLNAKADSTNIYLSVSDCGPGIPKNQYESIFDRFYRIPTGNRHDVKGQGLGLSYVKDIVQAHGGQISVSSTLGKGSTFTVVLPKPSAL